MWNKRLLPEKQLIADSEHLMRILSSSALNQLLINFGKWTYGSVILRKKSQAEITNALYGSRTNTAKQSLLNKAVRHRNLLGIVGKKHFCNLFGNCERILFLTGCDRFLYKVYDFPSYLNWLEILFSWNWWKYNPLAPGEIFNGTPINRALLLSDLMLTERDRWQEVQNHMIRSIFIAHYQDFGSPFSPLCNSVCDLSNKVTKNMW